jgi:predicted PurR-regulated permease PerM
MSRDDLAPAVHTPTARWWPWLVGVGLLALVWGMTRQAAVFAPFLLSFALAYVLQPIVEWLVRRRWPRGLAAGLAVLGAGLTVVLLAALLVPIVMDLVPRLRDQLPELAERGWMALQPWLAQWGLKVPQDLADFKPLIARHLSAHGQEWSQAVVNSLKVGGSALFTVVGLVGLVPVLAFYWLCDWSRILTKARGLVPLRWRPTVLSVASETDTVMGHYLRGQLLVMLILAVFYSVGLMVFGHELALPIGVFTGLAVCIPYLGFGLGLVLALLSGVLQFSAEGAAWWWPFLAVGVVYGIGQVVESVVLTPRLVGEQIGLHPLAVILALMLFGAMLGFVGVLIALPVSALLMVLARRALLAYQGSAWFQRGGASS